MIPQRNGFARARGRAPLGAAGTLAEVRLRGEIEWWAQPTERSAGRIYLDGFPSEDWRSAFEFVTRRFHRPPILLGDAVEIPVGIDRQGAEVWIRGLVRAANEIAARA